MFALPKGLKLNPFAPPEDAKLAFRTSILPQLWERSIPREDRDFFSSFWTTFETSYDVGNLLTGTDIHRILHSRPDNFKTLVHVLSDHLFETVRDQGFPSKKTPSQGFGGQLAAYRPTFLGARPTSATSNATATTSSDSRDTTRQVLNCLRVLSRLLPFVFHLDDVTLEDELFWKPIRVAVPSARKRSEDQVDESSHFVIDDDEEDGPARDEVGATPTQGQPGQPECRELPPLAERLVATTIDLLFVPSFTLPEPTAPSSSATPAPSEQPKGSKSTYLIWENGIGSTTSVVSNKEVDSNRIEVLRFLMVLMSKTLYIPTNVYYNALSPEATSSVSYLNSIHNRWHAYLVRLPSSNSPQDKQKKKVLLSLLCSLLNTYLKSGAYLLSSSSNALNIVGEVVNDSYEKLISGGKKKGDSTRLTLIKLCVQTINVLLGGSIALPTLDARQTTPTSPSSAPSPANSSTADNAFMFYVAKLHRSSDLSFIVENILTILLQPMNSSLLKMPFEVVGIGTTLSNPTSLAVDSLSLLWRLVECNPKLLKHLLDTPKKAHQLLGVLMHFCLEYKDDPAQLGLVKLSAFILQTVSAERAFGTALNAPFDNSVPLPGKWAVPGTAAEFLIQHIYTLIFSGGALNAIYPAFILTLTNISPYLKNPSIRSSTRLIQLFLAMSTPNFLLSDEANPRLVYYLLETFNNVIQHQLSDCPNLIYAIVRSHQRFTDLATFTCASGVAQIRRARRERLLGGAANNNASNASLATSGFKTPRRMSTASERSLIPVPTPGLDSDLAPAIEDSEKAALMAREQQQPHQHQQASESSDAIAPPDAEYPPIKTVLVGGTLMSEKAAGKRRARSMSQETGPASPLGQSVLGMIPDDEEDDTPWISKNGFQPTERWVASWREGLPLDTISILISECLAKVSSLSSLSSSNTSVIEYLRSVNLVGLLPPAQPPRPRPFVHSLHSVIWSMSLVWGNIYVQSLENNNQFAVWANTNVKLFSVRQKENSGVQAAVTNLVGQGLGMLSLGGGSGGHGTGNGGMQAGQSTIPTSPSFNRRVASSGSLSARSRPSSGDGVQ